MNLSQFFVGYWGQSESSLNYLINSESPLTLIGKDESPLTPLRKGGIRVNEFDWGVIGSNCLEEKSIASLSVGGFKNDADVWVKIEGNRLILGRDSFGRSTLYWLKQEKAIWFSSQFKLLLSLLKNPAVSVEGL